jgi:hypothetical protein
MLHWREVDPPDVAVDADQRGQSGRQVQVGGLVLDLKSEEFGDILSSAADSQLVGHAGA